MGQFPNRTCELEHGKYWRGYTPALTTADKGCRGRLRQRLGRAAATTAVIDLLKADKAIQDKGCHEGQPINQHRQLGG